MYVCAQGQARSEERYGRRGEGGGRGASFNGGGERVGERYAQTRSLFLGKLPLR